MQYASLNYSGTRFIKITQFPGGFRLDFFRSLVKLKITIEGNEDDRPIELCPIIYCYLMNGMM